MNSGMEIDPIVLEEYQLVRTGKDGQNYMICKIEKEKTVKMEVQASMGDYDTFVAALTKDNLPRYGLFKTPLEWGKVMIIFVMWASDNFKARDKMIYASSKDTLRKSFKDLNGEVEANDMDDLEEANFRKPFKKWLGKQSVLS